MLPATHLVVDSSVVLKWVLVEPGTQEALSILDRYSSGELELLAPELLRLETASVLSKRHRRKHMSRAQAMEAYEFLTLYAPRFVETDGGINDTLVFSMRTGASFWDSAYMSLADQLGCELITADRRMFDIAKQHVAHVRLLR